MSFIGQSLGDMRADKTITAGHKYFQAAFLQLRTPVHAGLISFPVMGMSPARPGFKSMVFVLSGNVTVNRVPLF